VVKGLGDVRLMALPGCKVTGSKLVNALIVMAFRLHVHYRVESAENKGIIRQPGANLLTARQEGAGFYLPNSMVDSPAYLW